MKKALSLVLALTLVFGLSVVSFAAESVAFDTGKEAVKINGVTATAALSKGTADDDETIDINVTFAGTAEKYGTFTLGATTTTTGVTISSDLAIDAIEGETPAATKLTLTMPASAVAVADLALKFTFVEVASSNSIPAGAKISGINGNRTFELVKENSVSPDKSYNYQLLPTDFTWVDRSGNDIPELTVASWDVNRLRTSHLNDVRITTSNKKNNGGTVRDITFNNGDNGKGVNLRLRTVKFYTKTSDTDFSLDIAIRFKTVTSEQLQTSVFANIDNNQIEVDEFDTDLDISDGTVFKATESLRNFEFQVHDNLFVTKNINNGAKVYCIADTDLSSDDEELYNKYSALDSVYTMYSVNVAGGTTTVRFDIGDTLFVYNKDFEPLGKTSDKKLPWSEKYYLTTAEIQFTDSVVVEEPTEEPSEEPGEPVEPENPTSGGGEVVSNANYNPNTGL